MKAWYDDIDAATLQRIKTYSAFNDAKSKNLMMQTMYEYREKEIQDFKETNHELAETCIARKKRIDALEKENAELKAGKVMNVSTEWHDLRKGPQNLPPLDVGSDYLSKNVLLDTGVIGCYNYSQKKWCVDMGYRLDKPVIAWCEIPKYTEE